MRDAFPGRYRPAEDEFDQMWDEGLFVPDTNVLLSLYRSSDELREALIGVFRNVKDRLWLPYQVAYEYMNRRLTEIERQRSAYTVLRDYLDNILQEIESRTDKLHRDSRLKAKDLVDMEEIRQSFRGLTDYLKEQEDRFPKVSNSPDDDEVWQILDEVFMGKIGNPYSPEKKQSVFEEGKKRYEGRVPPGYMDQGKDQASNGEERQFGDLLLWYQILDKAEQVQCPIVFISDERKEDWWWKEGNKIIGPRPELRSEVYDRAGVHFYIYRTDRFVEEASRRFPDQGISEEAIAEAHELGASEGAASKEASTFDLAKFLAIMGRVSKAEQMVPPEVRELQRQREEIGRMISPEVQEIQRLQEEIERLRHLDI